VMRDFTAVPNELVRGEVLLDGERPLSDGAFRLYCLILSYCREPTNVCTAAQTTLGARLGVSTKTVRARLTELEECPLIERRRSGWTKPSTIRPLWLPDGKAASGQDGKLTSYKEDGEDNSSSEGATGVVPLRRGVAL
jgi:helix-turn-helix protein